MDIYNFDEIRPFNSSELPAAFAELMKNEVVQSFVQQIFPQVPLNIIETQLQQIKTSYEFQKLFVYPAINTFLKKISSGLTFSGLENLDKNKAYLFITNHRDIVLDSALLNFILMHNKFNTTEIAIGDNLLIKDWIKTLVKINRSFIIQRNAPIRQMVEILNRQSAYIRQTITERNQSIWIAQREGRAKDSNDVTQESILKMFALNGTKSFNENLQELHICPISISYEYDPCDYLKAKEFQQKRDDSNFKKSQADDMENMGVGINGFKGKIHFHFCGEISDKISQITGNKNEQCEQIAQLIDKNIHANYSIYECNKIAYDLLLNTNKYAKEYSTEEKQKFEAFINNKIERIELESKDIDFLRTRILEMYANVLINYEKAH
ncbi:MAG: 1-acyl-sn-glycerol-3-phosphate acyltransferase [Paludibacteraceae bacterium]|nr:1-acyl-sn-glycerol-3-phosphate acyltransferase [Paludibacteraceae bacterium]